MENKKSNNNSEPSLTVLILILGILCSIGLIFSMLISQTWLRIFERLENEQIRIENTTDVIVE